MIGRSDILNASILIVDDRESNVSVDITRSCPIGS
jgi:hypothetical protein